MTELIVVLLILGAFIAGRLFQWVRDARAAMGTTSNKRPKRKG